MCVYRVWFGEKFYIGSTVNIERRIKFLLYAINGCFKGKRVGKNSQTNIMNHLIDNPSITEGIIDILEFTNSEHDLVFLEGKWIKEYFKNGICLNERIQTTRKIDGVLVRNGF